MAEGLAALSGWCIVTLLTAAGQFEEKRS